MQGKDLTPFLIVIGSVIVLVIAAGVVIFLLRRRLFGEDSRGESHAGVLETMRAMRARGEISEDEYRSAQAAIVAKASGASARSPDPARRQTKAPAPGELRSRPGYDLTGEPLPPSAMPKPPRRDPPSSG